MAILFDTLRMTKLRQIFLVVASAFSLLTSAQTGQNSPKSDSKVLFPFKQKDTTYWAANFRQFREAVFLGDKTKAKVFFNFPVKDESNEIWYIAYAQNEKAIDGLHNTIKPFTQNDFDKYFDKIFSKDFVKSLLKVKVDELYRKGTYQTAEIKEGSTTYILYSSFDETKNLLELNFASKTEFKDGKSESTDAGEFNIIYYFEITEQGHVKFKKIRLAG